MGLFSFCGAVVFIFLLGFRCSQEKMMCSTGQECGTCCCFYVAHFWSLQCFDFSTEIPSGVEYYTKIHDVLIHDSGISEIKHLELYEKLKVLRVFENLNLCDDVLMFCKNHPHVYLLSDCPHSTDLPPTTSTPAETTTTTAAGTISIMTPSDFFTDKTASTTASLTEISRVQTASFTDDLLPFLENRTLETVPLPSAEKDTPADIVLATTLSSGLFFTLSSVIVLLACLMKRRRKRNLLLARPQSENPIYRATTVAVSSNETSPNEEIEHIRMCSLRGAWRYEEPFTLYGEQTLASFHPRRDDVVRTLSDSTQ